MWFCETTNTSNMKHVAQSVLGWTERNSSLWYIKYTVGFYKPELCFYHAFLREIQTQLHTNKWAMWFESSSVKWLQFTPFLPVQVLKWRELTWQANATPWLLTGRTVNVQSCIVFAKTVWTYLQSQSTLRRILDECKQLWGGYLKIHLRNCWALFFKVLSLMSLIFCARIVFFT